MIQGEGQFRPEAVSEIMQEFGLNQSQLAKQIKVSRQDIFGYVHRIRSPQFTTIIRLASTFNKPLDFFVEYYGDRP